MIRILPFLIFLTFSFGISSQAQEAESMCDMHMHLSLKKYMQNIIYPDSILKYVDKDGKLTQVPKIEKFNELNWIPYNDNRRKMRKGKTSNFKNYVQADYDKLSASNYDIICGTLMPLEKNTVTSLFKRLVNRFAATKISFKKLRSVKNANNSFSEMLAEYYFLINQLNKSPNVENNPKIKGMAVVNDTNDIKNARKTNTTSIVITIEGGNALYGDVNSGKKSSNVLDGGYGKKLIGKDWQSEILRNVDSVKNLNHRVLYMGLTHFTWTRIAGQAKATDKSKPTGHRLAEALSFFGITHKSLHNKHDDGLIGYKPTKPILINGVLNGPEDFYRNTNIGEEVVRRLLARDGKHMKPILIDIRHMDVNARLHYYLILNDIKEKENRRIPIVMSHAAVSGENLSIAASTGLFPNSDLYSERRRPLRFYNEQITYQNRFKRSDIDENIAGKFNPWSVNLFDEEIETICDSDGLIGLIFYTLPLGADMKDNQSKSHYDSVKSKFRNQGYPELELKDYLDTEAFIRNAFYIASKSGKPGKQAWENICLGSDFDSGLDPMDIAPTVKEMPDFYKKFPSLIIKYLAINNEKLDGITPDEIAKNIFHDNMERFVWKNL